LAEVKVQKPKPTPIISPDKGEPDKSFLERVGDTITGKKKEERPVYAMEKLERAKTPDWMRMKVATPFNLWRKGTVAPIGSAIALAALAGTGAYYGAPWVARKIRANVPDQLKPEMSDEEIRKMRNRMALLAALGVGGLSVATNLDMRNPWGSMVDWNYGIKKAPASDKYGYERHPLLKQAMLGDFSNSAVMAQDIIPLDHAKEIIANDKYLTSGQKAAIGTIFDNTPDRKGDVSMADITHGAIRSGLGFAGGAVAGYALGKIFALPASVTRAASVTGGLAGALRSSGLIS
jgi:hypothetical protein